MQALSGPIGLPIAKEAGWSELPARALNWEISSPCLSEVFCASMDLMVAGPQSSTYSAVQALSGLC